MTTGTTIAPVGPAVSDRMQRILANCRQGRFEYVTHDDLNEAYRHELAVDRDGALTRLVGPDESAFFSRWLRKPRNEAEARDHFALQMAGRTEIGVAFGRVDVVMPHPMFPGTEIVVEVEPYPSYPNGVRQALAYARMTKKEPAIAVYGDLTADQARSLSTRVNGWCLLFLLDGDWQWVPDPSWAERHWSGSMWKGSRGVTAQLWWSRMTDTRSDP